MASLTATFKRVFTSILITRHAIGRRISSTLTLPPSEPCHKPEVNLFRFLVRRDKPAWRRRWKSPYEEQLQQAESMPSWGRRAAQDVTGGLALPAERGSTG